MDVASLAGLLHETAEHHDPYEKSHAAHNWWDWYAAYIDARQHGSTPDQATAAAGQYMEEVLHVPAVRDVKGASGPKPGASVGLVPAAATYGRDPEAQRGPAATADALCRQPIPAADHRQEEDP